MCLTLAIIVLHIVQRSKSRLNRQVVPLIARIGDRSANSSSDDVGLAVLKKKKKKTSVNNRSQLQFHSDNPLSFSLPLSSEWLGSTCMYVVERRRLHRNRIVDV